jgi:membrane protein YqaA with SNARE-associated domain
VPVASGLTMVSSDESELALVGLSLVEATVFPIEVAMMPENI